MRNHVMEQIGFIEDSVIETVLKQSFSIYDMN